MQNTLFSVDAFIEFIPDEIKEQYQITNLLTANQHNIIFEMISLENKSSFVLKILSKEYYDKTLYLKIFAISNASLLHPMQSFSDAARHYFIYPHLNTLAEVLSKKCVNYSMLRNLSFSIGNAIATLHQHGILHLDITPNNIFLDKTGQFYLGDFSSARFAIPFHTLLSRRYLRTGTTIPFAPSEEIQTEKVSYWNDCYNFALLLFALYNDGKFPKDCNLLTLPKFHALNSLLLKWTKKPSSIHFDIMNDFMTELEKAYKLCDEDKECQNYYLQLSDSENNYFFDKTPTDTIEASSLSKSKKYFSFSCCKFFLTLPLYGLLFFCALLFFFSLHRYLAQNPPTTSLPKQLQDRNLHDTKKSPVKIAASTPDSTKKINIPLPILDISHSTYQDDSFLQKETKAANLKILFANSCHFTSCSAFLTLSSLEELYLNNNKITDIKGLRKLSSLRILILSNNMITDISSLSNISSLAVLDLSHNYHLKNVHCLSSLKQLRYLILTNTNIKKEEILHLQRKLPHCTIFY